MTDEEEVFELNLYLDHLRDSIVSITTSKEQVHPGSGAVGEPVASPIADGGWVCAEATTWTAELTEHTRTVLDAWDDAVLHVQAAVTAEEGRSTWKDGAWRVPENDWRGQAYARTRAQRAF